MRKMNVTLRKKSMKFSCLVKIPPKPLRLLCFICAAAITIRLWTVVNNRVSVYLRMTFGTVLSSGARSLTSSKINLSYKHWPPDEISELYRADFGLYSLSLKPWVDPSQNIRNPKVAYIRLLKALFNDSRSNLSELEELVWLDRQHRLDGSDENFQLYPKVLDLHAVVSAIRSGNPVDQKPVSDPELLIIQAPELSCGHRQDDVLLDRRPYGCDLVVLIKSCTSCQGERAHARSTYMQKRLWVGFKIEFVFIVGLPFTSNSSSWKVDDVEVPMRPRISTKRELNEKAISLFRESQMHKDILIGGFRDSYENLTVKTIFALRWASTFCKWCSPLFLFMDDDIALNPKNFVRLVNHMPEDAKIEIIGGIQNSGRAVSRPTGNIYANRHALSWKQYPWKYHPPFLRGGGYLLGCEKVRDAAIASAFVKVIRMEDVFMAMIWEKLGYKCIKLPGFLLNPSSAAEVANSVLAFVHYANLHTNWKTGEIVQ